MTVAVAPEPVRGLDRVTPRHALILTDAARLLFEQDGFAGTTMEDIAREAGVARSTAYRLGRDTIDVLLIVATEVLSDPRGWPGRNASAHVAVAEWLTASHERHGALELAVRGVAASGVPRVRAFVAGLDLERHELAERLFLAMGGAVDERVHEVHQLMHPGSYAHLVDRCGWTRAAYVRWLSSALLQLRRSPPWD